MQDKIHIIRSRFFPASRFSFEPIDGRTGETRRGTGESSPGRAGGEKPLHMADQRGPHRGEPPEEPLEARRAGISSCGRHGRNGTVGIRRDSDPMTQSFCRPWRNAYSGYENVRNSRIYARFLGISPHLPNKQRERAYPGERYAGREALGFIENP